VASLRGLIQKENKPTYLENVISFAEKIAPIRPVDPRTGQPFTVESQVKQLIGLEVDPLYKKDEPDFFTSILTSVGPTALNLVAPGAGTFVNTVTSLNQQPRRPTMSFFDDIFGSDDSPGDNFRAGLAPSPGFDWTGLLNTGVNIAGNIFGQRGGQGVPSQLSAGFGVPAIVGGAVMAGRTVGAALGARLASLGLNRATAWTLLKQGGPAALLTLGLTAAEVASVARSRGGYRRMNICNGRALRRASRRLEGFHRFYKRTCGLPVRRSKSRSCK